ncbi:hypothetical protein [Mameliella sediminis]|uniref:hypothetical protein n=1 Tax=Mameliella sediminis TaxID=2836866 RepID=UPI001C467627|nr:hypothetical protein [Mameliella sediminis]MBV7393841.1 hypothetical protein [Mameliella sediminis]MBY6162246.1 hypothetical protein [Mameliella alba]MBY6170715.1 hypothetical protein [Mameliella alba]MBY6175733.1 hypothetical protein [Mameliella alba]
MRQIVMPALVVSLLAAPLAAEEETDGLNLMEEGAKLFLRGLMTEMEPALKELDKTAREMQPLLRDFAAEMGPALGQLLEQVEDWTLYHPPEMLDNGDIIIRRRVPLTPETPENGPKDKPEPRTDPDAQIDL